MWRYVRRYWHTLRHLETQQVTGRLLAKAKRWVGVGETVAVPPELAGKLNPSVSFPGHDAENAESEVEAGTFQFLNVSRDLGRPIDWNPEAPALWRFHLHYFQYLFTLSSDLQGEVCQEWIEANPPGTQPAWHPYPTSLRIINWCKAAPRDGQILSSLYKQAAYLYRHPETHLLGNHLLENARALIFASQFFGETGKAPEWGVRGLEIYQEQTPEQILADGGHFERSPMYHALVLEGYLDVLNLLGPSHERWDPLADVARRMTGFLVAMTHPDGHLAQFNDTAAGEALPASRLVAYAQEILGDDQFSTSTSFEQTGYYVYEDDDIYFVIDGGAIGPDYLPGHAHADIFSYELSLHQCRWIADTGVSTYESGAVRRRERGTPAHNSVTVDETNQVECWGGFRVARRFSPSEVTYQRTEDGASFRGRFDGYASLLGDAISHTRYVSIDARDRAIRIEDIVTGRGHHCIESRVHLHPSVNIQDGSADTIQLRREGLRVSLKVEEGGLRIDKGWHSPEFGVREETHVLVVQVSEELPVTCSYVIRY